MASKYNFTKSFISSLPPAKQGKRDYYKDNKVAGLEIMVTEKGSKSFKITRKKNGRIIRVTLGKYPDLSIENARKKAHEVNAQIAEGINPNDLKNELKQEISFGDLFNEYMERYSKKHKRSWKYDEREVNKFLPHWFKRKISTITNQEIRLLHEKVGNENGIYQANRLLERIRAIYNKAIEWGYKIENPTNNIKKFKEQSRDRFIQTDELPRFFAALEQEENKIIKDYILLSLYTGARKGNVLAAKWEQINFTIFEWRIPKTKNGDPQTIPLIEKAIELLKIRKAENEKLDLKDFQKEWVFPSLTSKSGHLADPKRAWKRILDKANIKDLRIHDIRRTLGSYQAITGASLPVIGKSLGHKSSQATQIYSRLNNDPVRQSMNKALDLINTYKNQ
jgi:integrase